MGPRVLGGSQAKYECRLMVLADIRLPQSSQKTNERSR